MAKNKNQDQGKPIPSKDDPNEQQLNMSDGTRSDEERLDEDQLHPSGRSGKILPEANEVTNRDQTPEIRMGTDADVTPEDLEMLGDPDEDLDGGDDELVARGGLDDTDDEGDLLNEGIADLDTTGDELDLPYSDEDDEENDYYSLPGDEGEGDNIPEAED